MANLKSINTEKLLRRWIDGDATVVEEQELLRRAADDPFLEDAMLGYQQVTDVGTPQVTDLRYRLRNKAAQPAGRRIQLPWRAMAAAVLILGLGVALWQIGPRFLSNTNTQVAQKETVETSDKVAANQEREAVEEVATTLPEDDLLADATTPTAEPEAGTIAPPPAPANPGTPVADNSRPVTEQPQVVTTPPQPASSESPSTDFSIAEAEVTEDAVVTYDEATPATPTTPAPATIPEAASNADFRDNPDLMTADRAKKSNATAGETVEATEIASQEAKRTPAVKVSPKGGMRKFDRYVKRNLQYPQAAKDAKVSGIVTLLFDVEPNGGLSNIRVAKSLGHGCDLEAIRLLTNGPLWSNPASYSVPSSYSFTFK